MIGCGINYFTRTSYTISQGSITLQINPLCFHVKAACIFNSLKLGQAVFSEFLDIFDFN